jgi:hypothetical protein
MGKGMCHNNIVEKVAQMGIVITLSEQCGPQDEVISH